MESIAGQRSWGGTSSAPAILPEAEPSESKPIGVGGADVAHRGRMSNA